MYLNPITKKATVQRLLRFPTVMMGVTHKLAELDDVQKTYNAIVNALYDGGAITVRTAEQSSKYTLKFSDGSYLSLNRTGCTCYSALIGNVTVVQIDDKYLYYASVDDYAVREHEKKKAEFSLTDRL